MYLLREKCNLMELVDPPHGQVTRIFIISKKILTSGILIIIIRQNTLKS